MMIRRDRRLLAVLLMCGIYCVNPAPTSAADNAAEKPVRLGWFPRFSPDGKLLITAHGGWEEREGGEVRVWDVDLGKEKYAIKTDRGIRTVAWSPKGKFFAAAGYAGIVDIYDAESGKPMDQLKFPVSVEVLQISPDVKRLITAHGDGSVRVTEWPSKKEIHVWKQVHRGGIWGMRLSANGTWLATAGKDASVRLYDMEKLSMVRSLMHPGETNGVAFTSDGKTLATGCADSTIRIFDVASGKERGTLQGHTSGGITDLQFSSDDALLASAGIDHSVRLWDVKNLDAPELKATLDGHSSFAFGVAISPKDKWLASAGWDDQVRLWDLADRELRWSWRRK